MTYTMAAKETVAQFSRVLVARLSFLHFTLATVFELSSSRSQWFLKRSLKLGECIIPYPFEQRDHKQVEASRMLLVCMVDPPGELISFKFLPTVISNTKIYQVYAIYIYIHTYIYTCIHIYRYTYVHTDKPTHTHIYIYIYAYTYSDIQIYIYIYIYIHIHIDMYTYINIDVYTYIHLYIFTDLYIYIYLYLYLYIYTYVHIYI